VTIALCYTYNSKEAKRDPTLDEEKQKNSQEKHGFNRKK